MKNKTRILVITLFVILFEGHQTVKAQESNKKDESQAELIEKLNLTEEQAVNFIKIQNKYSDEIRALREEGRSENTREKMKTIHDKQDAEIKEILTEEQFAVYTSYQKKKNRESRPERRKS